MTFSKGNETEKTTFMINRKIIENVKEFKYLGTTINKKKCSFTPTLKELGAKANRAIYAINSKIKLKGLPINYALKIFDAAILPILLYNSEVREPSMRLDCIRCTPECTICALTL